MVGKKMMKVTMMMMTIVMVMGIVAGQDGNGTTTPFPFTNCYSRCFFFCVIEPKNYCTCTSECLKKCLDTPPPATTMAMGMDDQHGQNLGYCKLGCATSLCFNISQPHNPDGESMGRCVDSCSSKCTMSY